MRITSLTFALTIAGCTQAPRMAQDPSSPGVSAAGAPSAADGGVFVTAEQTCPRGHDCNIVEVVDLHTAAASEDKGFDELRARASSVGGDAVIGAEFEHGDNGGPSHLSGVIVRYGAPSPAHVDLGDVDIPSDENDQDKGLTALSARAHEMGGDQVIDVTFEHGDDGAQGHLRGKVIRFTR